MLEALNKSWVVVEADMVAIPANTPWLDNIWVFNKARLMAGQAEQHSLFSSSNIGLYLCPAETYDPNLNVEYLLQSSNSQGNVLSFKFAVLKQGKKSWKQETGNKRAKSRQFIWRLFYVGWPKARSWLKGASVLKSRIEGIYGLLVDSIKIAREDFMKWILSLCAAYLLFGGAVSLRSLGLPAAPSEPKEELSLYNSGLDRLLDEAAMECSRNEGSLALSLWQHAQQRWLGLLPLGQRVDAQPKRLEEDWKENYAWLEQARLAAQRQDWDELQVALTQGRVNWQKLQEAHPALGLADALQDGQESLASLQAAMPLPHKAMSSRAAISRIRLELQHSYWVWQQLEQAVQRLPGLQQAEQIRALMGMQETLLRGMQQCLQKRDWKGMQEQQGKLGTHLKQVELDALKPDLVFAR